MAPHKVNAPPTIVTAIALKGSSAKSKRIRMTFKSNQEKEQKNNRKDKAKKIMSDNFTRSNKKEFNIKNKLIYSTKIISHFGGTNFIFADCTGWG